MIEKILIAFFLTDLGAHWIDRLYSIPTAPLNFPNAIDSRSRFRRPILFITMLFTIQFFKEIDSIFAMFFLTLITLTDLEQHVILDRMTLPFAIAGLVRIFYFQLDSMDHILSGVGGGLIFLLIAILTRGAVGGGDIKLIAVLGLWFGSYILISIVAWGTFFGGISAGFMLASGLKSRNDVFAYGPYFTIVAICFLITE